MRDLCRLVAVSCCVVLALVVGCGDDDQTDANADNGDNDDNGHIERPDSLQERCEAACERVYNECDTRFEQVGDDGGVMSEGACVDGCVDDDKFRGGEWCVVTEAECSDEPRDMIDACLPDDYHPTACDHLGAWPRQYVEFEQQVLDLVNDYRSDGTECDGEDRPAVDELQIDPHLRCAARLYSHTWVEGDEDEHSGNLLTDDEAAQWAEDAGFSGELTGSEVHHGHRDAIGLVDHWMEGWEGGPEDPQCSKVMDENAEFIGVGRYDQERTTVMFGADQ